MGAREPELAAALHRLTRWALAAELPVLAAFDIEMWDYVVLYRLVDGPAESQAELAAAVGRDKTRLIPILDRLEGRGLLQRTPDPGDRRNRIVTITPAGRVLAGRVHERIKAAEEDLLADLEPRERIAFRRTLARLLDVSGNRSG